MSEKLVLAVLVISAEIVLGISPAADRTTWLLENVPVFILLPIVCYVQPRIDFTLWTLRFMALHALVLMLGGHYTYAKVPLGFWMQDLFGFARNPYDRIGHFFQGFVPAFVIRELLRKKSPLKPGRLLNLTVVSMCLAFSALYELFEWASALILGQGADEFLGTQGDIWDTQWDMFMALVGASIAVFILGAWNERQILKTHAIQPLASIP